MLEALLRAIVADPQNEDRWAVLADFLEEHDDPRRATLLRLHRRLLATCCEPDRHPQRADWHARIVTLLAQGVRPCVPTRSVVLAAGVEIVPVRCSRPQGTWWLLVRPPVVLPLGRSPPPLPGPGLPK